MPRHITVGTAIDKSRISSPQAYIILFEVDIMNESRVVIETIRFCRNSENITYNGQLYTAGNFDISATYEVKSEPSLTLTAQDQSRFIHSRLEAYAGAVGSTARFIIINSENLNAPPEIQEEYIIKSSSCKNYVVTINLGAKSALHTRFPKRRQWKDRCSWHFKDANCKYAGADATCDYSLNGPNGCSSRNNEINFGGFPGIRVLYGL